MTDPVSSDTVTRITVQGREIILIGTAHISSQSVEEVEKIIREENPGRVCVEIDASRYKSLTEGQNWSSLNISQIIKQRKVFLLLTNLVLTSFQRRMGSRLGLKPGQEMMKAVEICKELNIPFSLSDREIQITLRRAWSKSSFWNKNKLLAALFGTIFTREELSEEEIENLKKKSAIEDMMDELAKFLPSVKEVLINERDRYLATNIFNTREEKIVAVVGAGHVPGIVNLIQQLEAGEMENSLEDISSVPKKSKISKFIPWLIPIIIVGIIVAGFFRSGWETTFSMLWMWVLVNGSLSAVGAIAALAHPLTIILSFIAAPITSMNPTIGVGIVTGLIEAMLRKPRVQDLENIHEDIMSFKGFYRNRFTHILLVFVFSSIGSAVGTFIGIPYLTTILTR